jgi:hypothetical protein
MVGAHLHAFKDVFVAPDRTWNGTGAGLDDASMLVEAIMPRHRLQPQAIAGAL